MARIPLEGTAVLNVEFECSCGGTLTAYVIRESKDVTVLQVEPCKACIGKTDETSYAAGLQTGREQGSDAG